MALIAMATGIACLTALLLSMTLHSDDRPGGTGKVRVDHFRDLNALHLQHARMLGVPPFENDREIDEKTGQLIREGKLERIKDTRYFKVDNLTHSHPYLTPEARKLVLMIGRRFHNKLKENGLKRYRFRITSLLRTRESQRRLSRVNRNASAETAHLYGTTFDIGWKTVYKTNLWGRPTPVSDNNAIRILSETIGELRKEGHLVVVTESKEACFHITLAKVH